MPTRHRAHTATALLACAFIALAACSSKPVFQVNYLLPPSAAAFSGTRVAVGATDARAGAAFLTPSAAKQLEDFSGLFSLVVLRSESTGDLVGAYEVMPLMAALCRQRLLAAGVEVVDTPAPGDTRFDIVLKSLQLDYAGRKWTAQMSYEAVARGPDRLTRRQVVSGSAERVKIMARRDAEKLVSELLTDMINKLDLGTLLGNGAG